MPSISASMAAASVRRVSSATCVAENRLHRRRDRLSLLALRLRLGAPLGGERVVLPRPPGVALAPLGGEQAGALHLVEGGIDRPFLQLELTRAPPLGFLEQLVAVHRPLAQQREDEQADSGGEEFPVVVHGHTLFDKVWCPSRRRQWRRASLPCVEQLAELPWLRPQVLLRCLDLR